MLDNFHLVAIITKRNQKDLKLISLHETLQENLTEIWDKQYKDFLYEKEEVDFTVGYTLEEEQHFILCPYTLPDWLTDRTSVNITNTDEFSKNDRPVNGIVAFARDDLNEELMLFQNFTPSQIIQPERFIFRFQGTFRSVETEDHGLRLDDKLSAVYLPKEEKLIFHSFRNVNTFLPLSDHYKEASKKDIVEMLSHRLFDCEDKNTLADGSTQWMRKRFAMLRDSDILDRYGAGDIKKKSGDYEVEIQVVNDKIVFPTDKTEAKKLLQLLNEEIFRGALTDNIYETNSKKKADL